jgi:hypothetical protein
LTIVSAVGFSATVRAVATVGTAEASDDRSDSFGEAALSTAVTA